MTRFYYISLSVAGIMNLMTIVKTVDSVMSSPDLVDSCNPWDVLPYTVNSPHNLWGRCNSVVLTQTKWLTGEAIRVACQGRLINFCSNLLSGYRGSIAYKWSLVWLLCWRSLSSVLEKLPLGLACWEKIHFHLFEAFSEVSCWGGLGILDQILAIYCTEGKFEEPHIISFFR